MSIFWLGGVVEKEEFNNMLKLGNTQIAANVTQLNYIEGLEEVSGEGVKILNSHYEPSFPRYKKLYIKRRVWKRNGKKNVDIGFLNIPILKYFLKSIALKFEMKKIINRELDKNSTNLFFIYAMTAPLMLLAPYIKKNVKDYKYKICLIVPDLPEFMNMSKVSIAKKLLSSINQKIINRCLKYIDKYVLFAESMANYLKLSKDKFIVTEGMVNIKKSEYIMQDKNINALDKKYIMYAGGLNEKYGILNLVKAFNKTENKDIDLWLYGDGDALNQINELANKDKRIKYKGIVSNDEILKAEKNATLLVNPRPTLEEYTKYSFPSKNMEYMLSGTPVLTTRLPAMPNEYLDYIYIFEDETIDGFKNTIEKILDLDVEELNRKGKSAREFVLKNKNNIEQTKKIIELISTIERNKK